MFLALGGVGGETSDVKEEEEEERKSDHNFAAQSRYRGERGGKRSFFLPRSKLTAALDTAIPSSQFGILRSHSNKMVRDNGAL